MDEKVGANTKEEMMAALIELIKNKTGMQGVFMILSDAPMPCKDEAAGKKCTTPHNICFVAKGITQQVAPKLLRQLADEIDGVPEEKGIPSPFLGIK